MKEFLNKLCSGAKSLGKRIAEKTKAFGKKTAEKTKSLCRFIASKTKSAALKFNSLGKKKMLAIILSVTVGVTALVGAGVTYASYKRKLATDNAVSAKSFYFVSNVLESGGIEYDLYNNAIKFDIMNYSDGLKTSEVDIDYNVTISSSDDKNVGNVVGTNTSGKLLKDAANKTTVTYTGLALGKTYTVTAEATKPYTKTISATFKIVEGNYEILSVKEDRGDYVLLTLRTLDFADNVNITWQNGYVPDNSEPILATATGTSHTTAIAHNSAYTLKFYKTADVTYDENAFSVTKQ